MLDNILVVFNDGIELARFTGDNETKVLHTFHAFAVP